MKNKKLINLYLLALALLSLITYILPLEKINPSSISSLPVTIVYYTCNIILLISLVLIILVSIVNLFQNNYEANKFSLSFSFIAFIMVFVNVIVYATHINMALSWGSIILLVEVFILYAFNRIVKTFKSFKDFGSFMASIFPKKKDMVNEEQKSETSEEDDKENE